MVLYKCYLGVNYVENVNTDKPRRLSSDVWLQHFALDQNFKSEQISLSRAIMLYIAKS